MANAPVKRFRIGYVTANVWRNESNGKTFHNVTLDRSYKDGDEYKQTNSLMHGDVCNAVRVLQRAEAFIADQD